MLYSMEGTSASASEMEWAFIEVIANYTILSVAEAMHQKQSLINIVTLVKIFLGNMPYSPPQQGTSQQRPSFTQNMYLLQIWNPGIWYTCVIFIICIAKLLFCMYVSTVYVCMHGLLTYLIDPPFNEAVQPLKVDL